MSYYENKVVPTSIEIPEFNASASPCTSKGGTSAKTVGCTENMIEWYKKGIQVDECGTRCTVKIRNLVAYKLYKSNSYDGAQASVEALKKLKSEGVVDYWEVVELPVHLNKVTWPKDSNSV